MLCPRDVSRETGLASKMALPTTHSRSKSERDGHAEHARHLRVRQSAAARLAIKQKADAIDQAELGERLQPL